jgi:hypothetical protein
VIELKVHTTPHPLHRHLDTSEERRALAPALHTAWQLCGDANGDGVFDVVDIAMWQRKLARLPVL